MARAKKKAGFPWRLAPALAAAVLAVLAAWAALRGAHKAPVSVRCPPYLLEKADQDPGAAWVLTGPAGFRREYRVRVLEGPQAGGPLATWVVSQALPSSGAVMVRYEGGSGSADAPVFSLLAAEGQVPWLAVTHGPAANRVLNLFDISGGAPAEAFSWNLSEGGGAGGNWRERIFLAEGADRITVVEGGNDCGGCHWPVLAFTSVRLTRKDGRFIGEASQRLTLEQAGQRLESFRTGHVPCASLGSIDLRDDLEHEMSGLREGGPGRGAQAPAAAQEAGPELWIGYSTTDAHWKEKAHRWARALKEGR